MRTLPLPLTLNSKPNPGPNSSPNPSPVSHPNQISAKDGRKGYVVRASRWNDLTSYVRVPYPYPYP